MIKKSKLNKKFFPIISLILFLSVFISEVYAETKIVAKDGDTLIKLSKQYGVPLKELMHKNNFNDANKIVAGEIILIPVKRITKNNSNHLIHRVKAGDTLYKIARDYKIKLIDIISINNLEKTSILKINQTIIIPKGSNYRKNNGQDKIKLASKKVFYHQVSKGDNLSEIIQIHNVSREEVIALNKLNDPIEINSNTKLKIRETKSIKWVKYGTFIINWADWRYLSGNYIAQARNRKNKPFFLALNCEKRTLNNTLKNFQWSSWYFPKNDYEFKIISDFCDHSFHV